MDDAIKYAEMFRETESTVAREYGVVGIDYDVVKRPSIMIRRDSPSDVNVIVFNGR